MTGVYRCFLLGVCLPYSSILKIEEAYSSETSVKSDYSSFLLIFIAVMTPYSSLPEGTHEMCLQNLLEDIGTKCVVNWWAFVEEIMQYAKYTYRAFSTASLAAWETSIKLNATLRLFLYFTTLSIVRLFAFERNESLERIRKKAVVRNQWRALVNTVMNLRVA
jgi:hypothetical protein